MAHDTVLLPAAGADPVARALAAVLAEPPGRSSAGWPYLSPRAWQRFRDRVPHLFEFGSRVLALTDQLVAAEGLSADERQAVADGASVVRQVVVTAAITAPPDLWLLRLVLGFFAELGLSERLLAGEALVPEDCGDLHPGELEKDLLFLLSRGIVDQYDEGFRIAGHPAVRRTLETLRPVPSEFPSTFTPVWRRLFTDQVLSEREQEWLLDLGFGAPRRTSPHQNHWVPHREEIDLGWRLLPVVLGLRAAEQTAALVEGAHIVPTAWNVHHPSCAAAAAEIFVCAGWMVRRGERYEVTRLGARGFAKGPGPFGIIETYHTYMGRGRELLTHGPGDAWVSRGENVGASQDANRATFEKANDALDRFCADTGFEYRVFVEHAIGRGEATRQRFLRSGAALAYVGADLEDAAIDAAVAEQRAGRLPAHMVFVRQADIGKPSVLIDALQAHGWPTRGAVMLVGNGFHEVRGQTDDAMVEVFRGYHDAGFVLLFTEENALSIDDLRATAFNTYHAGFRYVHDKSGQGLRPAVPTPERPRLGHPLRAAWSECALRAGYVRADAYCTRTRTVYPYTPKSGHNPSISVNHFFVPRPIAEALGLR